MCWLSKFCHEQSYSTKNSLLLPISAPSTSTTAGRVLPRRGCGVAASRPEWWRVAVATPLSAKRLPEVVLPWRRHCTARKRSRGLVVARHRCGAQGVPCTTADGDKDQPRPDAADHDQALTAWVLELAT